jgi:polyhydroxyalkanoate synthesis regulator phasin
MTQRVISIINDSQKEESMNQEFHDPEEPTTVEGKKQRSAFYDATRRVLLAGIGAAMLAQEEVESFVNRLIDRGEMAEEDARRLVREVRERRERLEREHRERKQSAAVSNPDIELLAARIAELTQQVEELKRQQSQSDMEGQV